MHLSPSISNTRPRASGLAPETEAVRRKGVLLINLGTPDSTDIPDMRRYLTEFLSDPDVIKLPRGLGWLNRPLGWMIARVRSPSSAELYRSIWTERGSPLRTITEDQVAALEKTMPDTRVFYAMRYGRPAIGDVLERIEACGIEQLVIMPMYPHFSGPTTGTVQRLLHRELQRYGHKMQVTTLAPWYDDAGYTHAQAALLKEYADEQKLDPRDTLLLFSAHGLPVLYVKQGDPYVQHLKRTIDLVVERLGWPVERCKLAYQSRLGPVEWLGPYTDHLLTELAREGERRVLVCPIAFTVDCLETLEELGLRYRKAFEAAGGSMFLCPALNTFEPFIAALRELALRGPKPIQTWRDQPPLMTPASEAASCDDELKSLVMLGVSLPGLIGDEPESSMTHTDGEGLRRAKHPQCDVPALLRSVREKLPVREAWVLNTCRRFEFYGLLERDAKSDGTRRKVTAELRSNLFPHAGSDGDARINTLQGVQAWRHMLRTVTGLNSGLPGERDVMEQLDAAHRLARRAGAAGAAVKRLIERAVEFERDVRRETTWGDFKPSYCSAALSGVMKDIRITPATSRVVVIGGSTTSASITRALIEEFDFPSRNLTLLYRGHKQGGQIKLLRRAIGHGRRIRVHSYSERKVVETIVNADLVFFGIDHKKPVLDAEQVARRRDYRRRPLTVIDFNTFGSTRGLESIEGVRLVSAADLEREVAEFSRRMCDTPEFRQAVEQVEARVRDQIESIRSGDDLVNPGRTFDADAQTMPTAETAATAATAGVASRKSEHELQSCGAGSVAS